MIWNKIKGHKALMALCLFMSFFLCLNAKEEPRDTTGHVDAVIGNLIGLIMGNDTMPEIEVPIELQLIVDELYADEIIENRTALDILSYVTGAYSEHGFYDRGGWARNNEPAIVRYVPYNGDLPDYEISDFQMPFNGKLTSKYGYRKKFNRFHKGIDIALNFGDTVKSALPGVVTKTGYEPGGYGNYVVITHDGGVETLYGHLMLPLVDPGDKIATGEPIGLGGNTGRSTGPHLHFETRYRGVALDPFSWFHITGN